MQVLIDTRQDLFMVRFRDVQFVTTLLDLSLIVA